MNQQQLDGLFEDWNEVYKKGQLTFWILLAIYGDKKYAAQINDFVATNTNGAFSIKEQSLYRALRRFSSMGLVAITKEDSPNGGPQRNYFQLNNSGIHLLKRFADEHIKPLQDAHVCDLLTKLAKEDA